MSEFYDFMDHISLMEPDAAQYLEEVGYAKWARSHFPIQRFYIATMNIVKWLNENLKDKWELPIVDLLTI